MSRPGPGLLLRDLQKGGEAQSEAALGVLLALRADVLVLTDFDYDAEGAALTALAARLAAGGLVYPYHLQLAPNAGRRTGRDLDGDGQMGAPRDAMGYGRFPGDGGMALLSRVPIERSGVQDFTPFLWADVPGALLPVTLGPEGRAVQRLSSVGHWQVPLRWGAGGRLHLLIWHGTPPVFDGPEDFNGRRNHDEAAFWLRYLESALPVAPPDGPVVVIGQANLDPERGDGRREAVQALLTHKRLQDPAPRGLWGLASADYGGKTGALRTEILLPDRALNVTAAGQGLYDPAASRHAPVWVEIGD